MIRSIFLAGALAAGLGGSLAQPLTAQEADSASRGADVSGAVTVTTKGISTIPSFTLGKPAAIFDLSIARRGLSFEPQFKFGLDGKPWSFLFWGRYKVVDGKKFSMTAGAHPALAFRTTPASTTGGPDELIVARRYLAGELNPSYALTKHLRVGSYYLYSRGLERDAARNTHFLSMRANASTVGATGPYVVSFTPQAYYLRVDRRDGFYLNSGLSLSKRNVPLSLSTMVNATVRSTVVQADDVLWNLSLSYAID